MFPTPFFLSVSYTKKIHSLVFAQPTLMKSVGNPKNVVDSAGEVASSPGLTNNSYCDLGPGALIFFTTIQASAKFFGYYPKLVRWIEAKTIHSARA